MKRDPADYPRWWAPVLVASLLLSMIGVCALLVGVLELLAAAVHWLRSVG